MPSVAPTPGVAVQEAGSKQGELQEEEPTTGGLEAQGMEKEPATVGAGPTVLAEGGTPSLSPTLGLRRGWCM